MRIFSYDGKAKAKSKMHAMRNRLIINYKCTAMLKEAS